MIVFQKRYFLGFFADLVTSRENEEGSALCSVVVGTVLWFIAIGRACGVGRKG